MGYQTKDRSTISHSYLNKREGGRGECCRWEKQTGQMYEETAHASRHSQRFSRCLCPLYSMPIPKGGADSFL